MKSHDNEKIKKTQPSLKKEKEIKKYIHHYPLKIKIQNYKLFHLKISSNFLIKTSVCPVAEGHCEVPRGCMYFYSLFFTALDALPCPYPALPLHCPALAPALPCFEFTFCYQGQEEEVT